MKFVDGLFKKLLVSIISTAVTIFIVYWNIIEIIDAFKTPDTDWNRVFIILACSIVVLLIMWISSFLKFLRNIVFLVLILILIFLGWFYFPQTLTLGTNGDMCVSRGVCKEGTEVKTVSGKIVMNSQTCTKNGWIWNSKKNICETKVKKQK